MTNAAILYKYMAFASVALTLATWYSTAADVTNLPEAVFDCGGNSFDLEAISAKRFPVPAGEFAGRAVRLKDDDPLKPVVLSINWARLRRTAPGGVRGFRFRYRCRNIRSGNGTGKVSLIVRGLATGTDGNRVKSQEDWPIRIKETGNQWLDFYLPDAGVSSKSDWMELLFDPGDGLGEIEIKDGSTVPFVRNEKFNPAKYMIAVELDALSLLDGVFTLASGGADNIVRFSWKLNDPKLRLDRRKLSLRLDLPPGVKSSNSFETIPSEMMPKRDWASWYAPFFHVTTTLAPGSKPGSGCVTAWYDGKPCSEPFKFDFAVEEAALAKEVPKRYFNGVCLVSPEADFSSATDLEASVKTMYAAGLRGISGNLNFHNAFKKAGPLKWDSTGAYFLADGFTVGTHPSSWDKCPDDQKFMTIDEKGGLVPRRSAVCPSTVYREKSYWMDTVVPHLTEQFGMRECYMVNWEPYQYFGKGCFCRNCLAEFAAFSGIPEKDVASDWPACVRTGGRFFEKALAFRSKQHGRLILVLDKTFRAIQGAKSKGFCPELVWTDVSGDMPQDPLSLEVSAKEYAGSLEWLNAWGPYVCWNASRPYMREKRRAVAGWVAAKAVHDFVRGTYGRNPKLISFPSGMQTANLIATPEWVGLSMDLFFLNGWEGSLVYYMRGLDVRWWRKFSESTTRAARYEDYVFDGKRVDDATALDAVREYAVPCRQVSAYLKKHKNVSPLQCATYDLNAGRIVAAINFWEEGAAFFRLSTRNLPPGEYTIVSDRETLWEKPGGKYLWTAEELEKGFFAGVGAARTKIFEIRPAAEHAERSAVNRQTPENLEAVYRRLKPALEEKARRDREEEAGRTILYPDGVLMI